MEKKKNYMTKESEESHVVSDSGIESTFHPAPLHIDITLEDNAVVNDIKKALKMIKGVASVRIKRPKEDNVITIEKGNLSFTEAKSYLGRTKLENKGVPANANGIRDNVDLKYL